MICFYFKLAADMSFTLLNRALAKGMVRFYLELAERPKKMRSYQKIRLLDTRKVGRGDDDDFSK
jgi:hypothetical protein